MIHITKQSGKTTTYLQEFVIDFKADIVDLPIDIPKGSSALCIEDGSVYILGTAGWKEI